MKSLFTLILAAFVVGCANQHWMTAKQNGCCGLSKAQWNQYDERAADAVLSPVAWARVDAKKPRRVQPTSRTDLFGTTNSPDGVLPPTKVSVHVPIGNSVKGCSHVVVEFSHPDGKIKAMRASYIYYD